jgi:hypothetical protein
MEKKARRKSPSQQGLRLSTLHQQILSVHKHQCVWMKSKLVNRDEDTSEQSSVQSLCVGLGRGAADEVLEPPG